MASLIYHLPSTFLPVSLFYFYSLTHITSIYLFFYIFFYFQPSVISYHQLCHYLPLCLDTSILWCNWIIFTLNSSSFGIYIFPSFNTKFSSICYLFPPNTFTLIFFISSTTITTSLSFFLTIFIFSNLHTSGSFITTSVKLQIYSSLINFWFSLFFSISTFQSGLLLSPSVFSIFVSSTFLR